MSDSWQPKEEFDPTWPYNFAWGYSGRHDAAKSWRITEENDPLHRAQFEAQFGHAPRVQSGDQLGTASYIPEERKLDGTLVAPPEIQMHGFYGATPHDKVYEHFLTSFPEAIPRAAKNGLLHKSALFPVTGNKHLSGNNLDWTWTPERGVVFGPKQFHPNAYTGHGEIRPDHVQIVADRYDTPNHAVADVKAALSKEMPNTEILLPESPEDAFVTDHISDLDGSHRHQGALRWANRFLGPVNFVRVAEADMEGCMVGLFIPEETCNKIKIDGGEPTKNMHVTLVYFQDKAADRDDWDEVNKIVEQIANQTPILQAKIGGYGLFASTGEDKQEGGVLWATVDIPGLAELKVKISEACEEAGFLENKEHGYTPHITLKHGWTGELPELKKPIEFEQVNLSVAQGEKKQNFKFEGGFEKKTLWEQSEWKWPGTYRFVTDGKETLLEAEDKGEWTGADLEPLHEKFQSFYPDSDQKAVSGWAIPTKDGTGYGVWAPKVGYGGNTELGLHDLIHTLDDKLKSPVHLVEDWNELTDPDLYASKP